MTKRAAGMALVLCCLSVAADAGESWQAVYADESTIVSIDTASVAVTKPLVSFREREVMLQPRIDPASMRHIQEIQSRRQADCASRSLSVLSRMAFSEQGTLVYYEATRPSAARWETPQSEREIRLLESACGPAP
jgi:hypothetical protein